MVTLGVKELTATTTDVDAVFQARPFYWKSLTLPNRYYNNYDGQVMLKMHLLICVNNFSDFSQAQRGGMSFLFNF